MDQLLDIETDSDNESDDNEESNASAGVWKKKGPFTFVQIEDIKEKFDKPIRPIHSFSSIDPPIVYFQRFFNKSVMDLLVQETNRYARDKNIKFILDRYQ